MHNPTATHPPTSERTNRRCGAGTRPTGPAPPHWWPHQPPYVLYRIVAPHPFVMSFSPGINLIGYTTGRMSKLMIKHSGKNMPVTRSESRGAVSRAERSSPDGRLAGHQTAWLPLGDV
ncbi:hypothetical protein BO82DRAFT_202465 [Aspergillus uvarum CBS 121591]|uniref:Uncharacterized protein n=1 Tax=Aspergillus uvarum CBS 121591 TaxID=1448315 RepID=A0A319BW20_9EURO|nr:hypothetical protein BO82DRAFT_202465 [Aspergillus uvarum CBS 121591]PYH76561.1 hypothetical protein BO82DRAFT_202465 [Aspergillus uvarum CBS 121591]